MWACQVLAAPQDEGTLACMLAARHTAVGRSRLARLDETYRLFASAAALPSPVGCKLPPACTQPGALLRACMALTSAFSSGRKAHLDCVHQSSAHAGIVGHAGMRVVR